MLGAHYHVRPQGDACASPREKRLQVKTKLMFMVKNKKYEKRTTDVGLASDGAFDEDTTYVSPLCIEHQRKAKL